MRIIAGEFRSRQILAPENDTTRPITDRAKQSLFDILTPHIEGAIVYDCFAGTGSMGLECLSRGAAHVAFFEADRSAATRLRKNIASLGVQSRSTVINHDLFKWFGTSDAKNPANLAFLDPPYGFLTEQPDDLRRLAKTLAQRHLDTDGIVIFRHEEKDQLDLAPLRIADQRTYGAMTIELLRL